MPQSDIITLYQGNTYSISYSIKDSEGDPKDLTGTTELKFALAKGERSPTLVSLIWNTDTEVDIPDNNTVSVELTSAVLNNLTEGRYYFEFWHKDSQGVPTTLVSQKVNLLSKLIKA